MALGIKNFPTVPYQRLISRRMKLSVTTSGVYTANDQVGGVIQIPEIYSGQLLNMRYIQTTDSVGTSTLNKVWFYERRPLVMATDNQAFSLDDTDLDAWIGQVSMTSVPSQPAALTTGIIVESQQSVVAANSTTTLPIMSQEADGSIYIAGFTSNAATINTGTLFLVAWDVLQWEWPGVPWRSRDWIPASNPSIREIS